MTAIDLCFWVNDMVKQSEYKKLWDIDIHSKDREAFTRKPTPPPRPDNRKIKED